MTSEDVRPKCSQRADGPTCSATAVVKAITSCWVIASISSMRGMSKSARARISRAASAGTIPARAIASTAASSTCSQVSYFRWSLQMRPISGLVYRGIIYAPLTKREPLSWNLQPVHGTEHSRGQGTVGEKIPGHALDVGAGDPLDAFERFVQTKLAIEVDLLTRQMRHPARRAFEIQHQATLQM